MKKIEWLGESLWDWSQELMAAEQIVKFELLAEC